MKIGILTHCIANNFGANLQALSTGEYLRNHGYEPVFFFWDAYLRKRSVKMHQEQLKMHRTFLQSHGFEITEPCSSEDDFAQAILSRKIKNIIVGSDAVFTYDTWINRLDLRHFKLREISEDKAFPNPFWIPFDYKLSNCKFFYLSPSCQSTFYRLIGSSVRDKMRLQMSKFSYLSARDTCTRDMMRYILKSDTDIPITPDPVWGFAGNVKNIPPKEYVLEKYRLRDKYILMSFYNCPLNSDWITEFQNLAYRDDIEVYSLPMPQGKQISGLPHIDLPIDSLDWFALIKYSYGYVGHNMHPIIVAMHSRVPFFSIDQHGQRIWRFFRDKTSKVYDLLNRFSFQEQRVCAYKTNRLEPSYVYNKLKNFNIVKCDEIAREMESMYLEMMNNICLNFIKSED